MRKRFFLWASLLCIAASVSGQQATLSADAILKDAYTQATKEGKKIFVMFHASWCVWCHRMDNSMQDPACKKFFDDNYVISHLVVDEAKDKKNLENPGAADLRKKFNGDGVGIPYWVVLDNAGNILADSRIRKEKDGPAEGDNCGCPATEKEVAFFIGILKKTSALTEGQLEIIRKRFRENDK